LISGRHTGGRLAFPGRAVILTSVSRRQRIRHTTLAMLASASAAIWVIGVSLVLIGGTRPDTTALGVLWLSGLGALVLTVAACRVEDDSTDDPAYFSSIVRGLRAEWTGRSRG
jgi:hypothetical protein